MASRNNAFLSRCCLIALLLCFLAAATTAQNAPPILIEQNPLAPTAEEQEKFSVIVVFRDAASLLRIRAMCLRSPLAYQLAANKHGLPAECHMPRTCRRIYSTAIFGFSGEFSSQQLDLLPKCLPDAVWYKELDIVVKKAEDESMMMPHHHNHPIDPMHKPPMNASDTNNNTLTTNGDESTHIEVAVVSPIDGEIAHEIRTDDGGKKKRRLSFFKGRKLKQQQPSSTFTNVHSYEEAAKTKGEQEPPIDLDQITHGVPLTSPQQKSQNVDPKLWNLDRIDQKDLPLNGEYMYGGSQSSGTGTNVTIYVIDSGIKLDHQEFQSTDGSGTRASYGYDFVDNKEDAADCDGHGTHIAATASGLRVGVAKNARVVAVRILDCTGSGTVSNTVAALDWIAARAMTPSVAILSLGVQVGSWSRVLEDAVRSLVLNQNITVVVASGNSNMDACYVAPSNVPEVITVSAIALNQDGDQHSGSNESVYKFSNTGPCIDIWAPGTNIYSACASTSRCDVVSTDSYSYASGTSMKLEICINNNDNNKQAVPLVAGVAALYLESQPEAGPQQVADVLISNSIQNVIDASSFKAGTVNRLLYSGFIGQDAKVQATNGN